MAACRAVLFAQLVDDPSAWPDRFPDAASVERERARLHKVIERIVPWEASNDEAILQEARHEIARSVAWGLGEEPPAAGDRAGTLRYLQEKAPPVYDPFSGGGSIPLEAQRLGLRAHGSDLNPVAVLIGKALVEIPPRFAGLPPVNPAARASLPSGGWRGAAGLAVDVRHYGMLMREKAAQRIGHLYPKAQLPDGGEATVIAWLWARTVRSPDPEARGAMVPMLSSFLLSTKLGRKVWIEPVLDTRVTNGVRFDVKAGVLSAEREAVLRKGTKAGRGANFTCIVTGSPLEPTYVRAEAQAGRMGVMPLAVVADGKRERIFLPLDSEQAIAATSKHVTERPDEVLHKNNRYMTPTAFGMERVGDLFLDRQLLVLNELVAELHEVRSLIQKDATSTAFASPSEYCDAITDYLALSISRQVNRSSTLCFWDTEGHKIQQVFARQALSMTWDFAESNPFSDSSGNFLGQIDYLAKVVEVCGAAGSVGSIIQSPAQTAILPRGAVVSTDPPYYDNVPYADISDFFYVWLRRCLRTSRPDLFARILTPKIDELVAFPDRFSNQEEADQFFISGMQKVFGRVRAEMDSDYPTTIYYAFRQAEPDGTSLTSPGWSTFLQAVVNAGHAIDGTWPMRTELVGNLKKAKNALASSIVLVCRKRPDDAPVTTRAEFVRTLRRELPDAVAAIRRAGVGPVDMQQAVIGPGMGVFTRYAQVLEDDDSPMPVRTALSLINRVWDEIENEAMELLDPPSQVALAWFAAYGFDVRPSGDLITLANAKNLPAAALFAAGVFHDGRGKAALMPRDQLPPDWTPTDGKANAWGCVQHAIRTLNAPDGGAGAAAALLAAMGPMAEPARALADRLFRIATEKGWAAEALAYNALAEEWPHLLDMAAQPGHTPAATQAELFSA